MSSEVRVRFAPSPTGPLHIGGVRTALYNYLFAKKLGGTFILRIEDTDQTRYVKGAEEYIVNSLEWAGMEYDEGPNKPGDVGPYRQSERKGRYKAYAEQLVDNGWAYYAFDTPEEIDAMRERLKKAGKSAPKYDMFVRDYMKNSLTLPEDEVKEKLTQGEKYVIRLKIPRNEEVRFHDEIRGWVSFQSNQLDDKVLFKSDGMPTYHLANIVDDHEMKISHVIRGEEWLPSAPLHYLLYKAFGWLETMPKFAHLPLILKPDGNGKLSKRDGDRLGFPVFPLSWDIPNSEEKITGYRESGYLPEAFRNILVMLGWNPGTEQEIFSKSEMIEAFSLERVGKSGAKFDPEKAKWYNQQFLRKKDNETLAGHLSKDLEDKGIKAEQDYIEGVVGLVKEKATFISELYSLSHYFFIRPTDYDEKVIKKKFDSDAKKLFKEVAEQWSELSNFTAENIQEVYSNTAKKLDLKAGKYMQVMRVLISGEPAGPAIFDMIELIGQKESVERVHIALKKL